MSETESSLQIELGSGKRAKVKAANVLLKLRQPRARRADRRGVGDRRRHRPRPRLGIRPRGRVRLRRAGAATISASRPAPTSRPRRCSACSTAPHYFRRLGKGNFKKAPEEIVKAALLGIERKQPGRGAGRRLGEPSSPPAPARRRCASSSTASCSSRTRTRPSTRPSSSAAQRAGRPPLELLKAAGAIDSPYEFHWRRFLFENFPRGTGFPPVDVPAVKDELPLAAIEAFSIDDSATTEIDDALSVQGLGSGRVTVGIHIAAPALAFAPQSAVDRIARDRLSTVYMPGHKLTMLPDAVVEAYTLAEGREAPVRLALRDVRRGDARHARFGNPARAHPDRRQPAPRPARRAMITEATLAGRPAGDAAVRRRAHLPARPGAPPEGGARAWCAASRRTSTGPTTRSASTPGDGAAIVRRRAGGDRAAPARLAARPDRRRGDDPGEQHLGRLARGLRRAGDLSQPGEPGARRQGAHGHAARAARRHGRGPVRLGDLAAAPLRRPGEPVAAHRLRPPRQDRRAGGAVSRQGRQPVRHRLRLRRRLRRVQRLPGRASSATGPCARCSRTASASSTRR